MAQERKELDNMWDILRGEGEGGERSQAGQLTRWPD